MSTATGPMACPVDGATLTMSERSGIEIDYCPTCRGVWLDRGELDKIIARSDESAPQSAPAQQAPQQSHAPQPPQAPWGQQPYPPQGQQSYPPQGQQPYGQYGYKPHKRRKSFLEELFD